MKTLKIRFFDNLICINAIYTTIRFIRNTNLSNKHQYIASNREKTKLRKSSEKIFCWFSILMQFPKNWKSCWFTSNFYVLIWFQVLKIKTNCNYNTNSPCSVQNSVIKWQNGKNGELHKYGKSTKYFFWTFSSFCFLFIWSNVLIFVAQINDSNKSYGCVDGIYAN